jgi:hypothetical protein
MTVQMIADELQIGKTSVYSILKEDLEMRKICAKIVPKLLTPKQKLRRKQCCIDWKALEERDSFLERIITSDESWIYAYKIELKSQSKEWKHQKSPRPKKAWKSKLKVKVMLIVFFDCHGIVRHEFVPEGQTVNAAFYVEVLKHLRDRVHHVWPNLRGDNGWILHQDNDPSHIALILHEFLAHNSITMMDHPLYSPDVAPCDFLFPKCKLVLCGWHLGDVATITAESTLLKGLKEDDVEGCFNQWKWRWDKCTASEGGNNNVSIICKIQILLT